MRTFSLVLKLCTLALMVVGGGFWTEAAVGSRPKYRDEQTWIAGTIWSQTIVTIGLIITNIAEDNVGIFVHAYFLATGLVLFLVTGAMLVYYENKALKRSKRNPNSTVVVQAQGQPRRIRKFDKTYFLIGVICLLGGLLVLIDLILLFVYKD